MRPDRTIGLKKTKEYREMIAAALGTLNPGPLSHEGLIYPFLVVEAKRESDGDGFSLIEMQTAFPIRRFLKTQQELYTACKIRAQPLVWFFGSRGDEWRVYGGTIDGEDTVRPLCHLCYTPPLKKSD
jgi:hypothetical protein